MSMRLIRKIILPMTICLTWTGPLYAATVTVDMAAKTATSDSAAVEPVTPRVRGEQVGVLVKSTIVEPQDVRVRFAGLKDQGYDAYVNGEFKGPKPAKEFENGVQYRIDGRITDPAMMRCLTALQDPIRKAYDRLQAASSSEAIRVRGTLSQASDWVTAGLGRDQAWRSVTVVLAPAGKTLEAMAWPKREDEYGTARAATTACWLLQKARDRMYHAIEDPALRNEAVVTLTPVEFTAAYSVRNGKPHIDAKLTNNCDLPVSGEVSFALPAGWKANAKKLKFAEVKSGQVFSTSFDLIAPSKAAAPDSIPIAANVTVTRDIYTASLKLKVVAHRQTAAK
jgi:hypothetical protein